MTIGLRDIFKEYNIAINFDWYDAKNWKTITDLLGTPHFLSEHTEEQLRAALTLYKKWFGFKTGGYNDS